MISSFPNLFIIPFVLLSGKMSESKNKIKILILGLIIFLASGILYLFAKSIISLILISCLLGVGAGMVTPLSTGLVADFFIGKYRTKQMGLSSGINNLTLVIATVVAGWLATKNWHLPFIVYLIPVFALLLSRFLTGGYLKKENASQVTDSACDNADSLSVAAAHVPANKKINAKLLVGLMVVYFLMTYIIILVSYNLSFILEKRNVSSTGSGWLTSILFLAITIPGFCITPIVKFCKNSVVYLCFFAIVIGFLMILIIKSIFFIALGTFLIGGAYGIVQPLIYDKTSLSAKPQKAVFVLACVMSANYLAIYLCPYIASGFQSIFGQKENMAFPFWINMIMALIIGIIALIGHKKVLFSAESSMFHEIKSSTESQS